MTGDLQFEENITILLLTEGHCSMQPDIDISVSNALEEDGDVITRKSVCYILHFFIQYSCGTDY